MKKIEKMDCPGCGQTMICLSEEEEKENGVFLFWCGDCDIDVTVEVND